MSRTSFLTVQPIFRHFMPLSKDLVFHTPVGQTSQPFLLNMHQYLIQGAFPLDSLLISQADNNVTPQFQGGYMCSLEIMTQPMHGVTSISDDKRGFGYLPLLGYRGGDAFSYRIVNMMGQPSNVSCISLFVRI